MPVKKGEITSAVWTNTVQINDEGDTAEVQATVGNGLAIEIYNAIRNTGAIDSIDDITKVINQAEIDAGRENLDEDGNPDPIIIDPIMGPNPEKQEESNLLWTRISSSIADAVIQHMTIGGNDGGEYHAGNSDSSGPLQTFEAEDQIIFLKNRVKELDSELVKTNQKIQELVTHLNATNDNIESLCDTLILEAAQRTATQAFMITAFLQSQNDMQLAQNWINDFVTSMGEIMALVSGLNPAGAITVWNTWLIGHATIMTSWETAQTTLNAANTSLGGVAALDLINAGLIADNKDTAEANAEAAATFSTTLNDIIAACQTIQGELDSISEGDADNVV